jgi:hypothetical protein
MAARRRSRRTRASGGPPSYVHGAASVVVRALGGVGHEVPLLGWYLLPEDAGHGQRAVGVEDQKAEAPGPETHVRPHEVLRHPRAEESARFGVQGAAQKVAGSGVTDVQADRGVERGQVDEGREQAQEEGRHISTVAA